MAQRTLPSANVAIGSGKCVHCGREYEVKITSVWYQKLLELLKQINTNTDDLNP